MEINVQENKERYISREIWLLTVSGAFQRARIYANHVSPKRRAEFRTEIRSYLQRLVQEQYRNGPVTGSTHIQNIEDLCNQISSAFGDLLQERRFRIGVGQKLLNLHLKYLWCLNKINMPPHFPIDRIILEELKMPGADTNWTKFDDIETYKEIIANAEKTAKDLPLAEWELAVFQRRSPQ